MRFLVIDDSSVDRHLLTTLLQELGHEVETANQTEGALARLKEGNYAALFLDIVMPQQDGYKFLRALRSDPDVGDQRVIFYSSKKTSIEINYGVKRAGADDYITKPVTREALVQALQKLQP